MPLPQEPPPLVEVSQVVTTLKTGAWDKQIQELPDHECAEFVSQGLREEVHEVETFQCHSCACSRQTFQCG